MGAPARPAGWFFQRFADKAIAVSNAVRDYVIQGHRLRGDFVETIYNGIEASDFLTSDSPEYARVRRSRRAQWGIAEDDIAIGVIGRFCVKGQHELIGLMPAILRDFPGAKLVLVGADNGKNTDRKEPPYRETAKKMGVAEHVVITGLIDDVPSLLPMLDVLVHLPINEAFGLALVEANASGIPVIASDIPGCREVIDMTRGGVVIDPSDNAALLSTLLRMFDPIDGPALRRQYGRQGRRAVVDKLDMPAQIQALEDLYDRLTGTTACADAVEPGK
jgi:glycosyltransferase involved in cell wall biosynthesis